MTDTQVAPDLDTGERKDLAEMLGKLGDVGSVELKMNVPVEQRFGLRKIQIDVLKGRLREVVFFDTPDLALYAAGVVLRGRRTQGGDDDNAVKLRPCVPSDLPPAIRNSPNVKVEMDVTRRSHVVSASLKGTRSPGALQDVLSGALPLEKFLTKEQRPFLAEHMPSGVSVGDLIPLGPIYVILVKGVPEGLNQKLTFEQWHFPGQTPLVELSVKTVPFQIFTMRNQIKEFLEERGLTPTGEQEPKTRKALQFFAARATG